MPPMNEFKKLIPTEHMLKWLSDKPYEQIISQIESMLGQQVPGSKIIRFSVNSEPDWLSGGRKNPEDEAKVILVRAGVAFEFALIVQTSVSQMDDLSGVFTWCAVNLDVPGDVKQRYWLDIDESLETFGSKGELKDRIYFE